jgi:phosphatidate cytidylyltransferase
MRHSRSGLVGSEEEATNRQIKELQLRTVSALALGGCALAALFAGPIPFGFLVLLVALVMSWEWGHIVRAGGGMDLTFIVHALTVSAAILVAMFGSFELALGILVAGGITLVVLNSDEGPGVSVLGALYVGIPAIALICLRSSQPYGLTAVMFIFAVVWAGDIAAFLGGRQIGGIKLYPSVSPNKTWAGLVSAVVASILVGAVFWSFLGDAPLLYLLVCAAGLGLVAQLGDLAESALKRLFRVKDSSDLIPGHGGFMDRMDGIVAAACVALAVGLLINSDAPARALLYGS